MADFAKGPTTDTAAGDIVVISVPPDGPYGVNFVADVDGFAAVIHSFDRLPNGKFGPLQKHGGLHYGDVLFEINDVPLLNLKFSDAVAMVSDKNSLKKTFKFMNSKEYYRKKRSSVVSAKPTDGKNNFLSVVKRTRMAQIDGKKVTEFEIASQLRVTSLKVSKEIVYQWSVWKRYSDFDALNNALRTTLGWQMDGIIFPSAHTFVLNKFTPEFVEQRRDDLKEYWIKILAIDKITDFSKHHCSEELKSFLEVEENTKQTVDAAADMVGISDDKATEDDKQGAAAGGGRPASVRRGVSVRRKSTNVGSKSAAFNYDDENPVSTAALGALTVSGGGGSSSSSSSTQQQQQPPPAMKAATPAAASTATSTTAIVKAPATAAAVAPVKSVAAAAPAAAPAPKPAAPTAAPATAPPPPTNIPAAVAKPNAARANLLGSIAALRKD